MKNSQKSYLRVRHTSNREMTDWQIEPIMLTDGFRLQLQTLDSGYLSVWRPSFFKNWHLLARRSWDYTM